MSPFALAPRLRLLLVQRLARLQKERHARPALVAHAQDARGVRRRAAVRADVLLLAVVRDCAAGGVLADDAVVRPDDRLAAAQDLRRDAGGTDNGRWTVRQGLHKTFECSERMCSQTITTDAATKAEQKRRKRSLRRTTITLTFSSRMSSAESDTGDSMAMRENTCAQHQEDERQQLSLATFGPRRRSRRTPLQQ